MRKIFLTLLPCCILLFTFQTNAEEQNASLTFHMAILMSADAVEVYDDPAEYEGVDFPLFCGIASVYPKENRFVFTKMTDLPIRKVENALRQVEQDGYITEYGGGLYSQIQPKRMDFHSAFLLFALSKHITAYLISYSQEVPVGFMPRFTRTCRYSTAKKPPTDCAYYMWEMKNLCIPPTDEEISATIDWK